MVRLFARPIPYLSGSEPASARCGHFLLVVLLCRISVLCQLFLCLSFQHSACFWEFGLLPWSTVPKLDQKILINGSSSYSMYNLWIFIMGIIPDQILLQSFSASIPPKGRSPVLAFLADLPQFWSCQNSLAVPFSSLPLHGPQPFISKNRDSLASILMDKLPIHWLIHCHKIFSFSRGFPEKWSYYYWLGSSSFARREGLWFFTSSLPTGG